MIRKPADPHRPVRGYAALAIVAISLLGMAPPAWAYLDPGTGSMIISAIVGLLATAGLAIKTYWYKIKAVFRKDAPSAPVANDAAENSSVGERAGAPERSTER